MHQKALIQMSAQPPLSSMDVIIIVAGDAEQEYYWFDRLATSGNQIVRDSTKIIVVHEDWPGGAGNGLGTLYAFQKACDKAASQGMDLVSLLDQGAAVAMYHTAGRGMRLAPLPGAEQNNKPAVKLPYLYQSPTGPRFLTLLEAVLRQTSVYAPLSKGRLSVFWGDQIFVPSSLPDRPPEAHVALLASVRPLPDREEWNRSQLHQYGFVGIPQDSDSFLLEKIPYATLEGLVASGTLSSQDRMGASLGCFSISSVMLRSLRDEFSKELKMRAGKLDSDPHFWMPLTLSSETYCLAMQSHNVNQKSAQQHYQRMSALKQRLESSSPLFKAVDVGTAAYWWDFGTLSQYFNNSLLLAQPGEDAEALRTFLPGKDLGNTLNSVEIDQQSYIQGSHIQRGSIRNSVVVGVHAEELHIENCVLVNCTCRKLSGEHALAYDVVDADKIRLPTQGVQADIFLCQDPYHVRMCADLDSDGKANWNHRLAENPFSYAEIFESNQQNDLAEGRARASQARLDVWSAL